MSEDSIIETLCNDDEEFKQNFEEHVRLEQDLEALYSLKFFPPEVEANIKTLKLNKLKCKDFMDKKIESYKHKNNIN